MNKTTVTVSVYKTNEQFLHEFVVTQVEASETNVWKWDWYLKTSSRTDCIGEPDDEFEDDQVTMECARYFNTEKEAYKDLVRVLMIFGICKSEIKTAKSVALAEVLK